MRKHLILFVFSLLSTIYNLKAQSVKESIYETYFDSFQKRLYDSTFRTGKKLVKADTRKNVKIYNLKASNDTINQKVKLEFTRKNQSGRTNSLTTLSLSGSSTPSSSTSSFGQLIVYPSPTVASITINAQSEVDLYTGRFGVSIPLTTLKSRMLEVPISLNYSADGAKVDDLGSWVSYGWGLNAGGAISRVMHDLPDEFVGNVSPLGNPFPAFGYLNTKSKVNLAVLENSNDGNLKATTVINSDWHSLNGNFGVEAWDLQPDEFYFNFSKYSGKFVFDQDGNIVCVPFQNLNIYNSLRGGDFKFHDLCIWR